MSVRVVARIRPLLKSELEKDTIVEPASVDAACAPTLVRIPNPKNAAESYSFNFNSVYDQKASQQDVFDNEISPTVKHLFSGLDVTIFAYGVTGTGKTHTMRGGKSLADRGVIPRLLSAIYRRGRKIEKDSAARVEVAMSYYEIYNDKVYDLFEAPEKRTAVGLPIRDNGGKTVVCGLTERPCSTLKEFETLYDQANVNRSTAGTKLNAHSSRSHAILCVKVTQLYDDRTVVSQASAIDLAGSEDNRRTDNGKERLVESSAINRSLFVLAQCVEAISKKQNRVPYRESKMTRILSLGQNNGLTVMILNLCPLRSYHLDTLSSLNFANRTKKIEVREVENEPVFRVPGKPLGSRGLGPPNALRQPLRPLPSATNIGFAAMAASDKPAEKPVKSFPVFSERNRLSSERTRSSLKRPSDLTMSSVKPAKASRTSHDTSLARRPLPSSSVPAGMTKAQIEDLVNRMVDERLASRPQQQQAASPVALPEDLQRRLEALEHRVTAADDSRAEGLQLLLRAKQAAAHGDLAAALHTYRLALPFFPDNEKLAAKMLALQRRLGRAPRHDDARDDAGDDASFAPDDDADDADDAPRRPARGSHGATASKKRGRVAVLADFDDDGDGEATADLPVRPGSLTPRTAHVLGVINSRDAARIRGLKGVGAKRAAAIVDALVEMDGERGVEDAELTVGGLEALGARSGIAGRGLLGMREGVVL